MNNNGFSIMRYLRDLGADAHLFPFSNDGIGPINHFAPKADTWHIEKWKPFIHPFEIPNTIYSIVPNYKNFTFPHSRSFIKNIFKKYDYIIGSGIAPALLLRINRHLDIYYPYSTGVEYINTIPVQNLLKFSSLKGKILTIYVKEKQSLGVKKARYCITAETNYTSKTFNRIGANFLQIGVPMVYNREKVAEVNCSTEIKNALRKIKKSGFSIVSHARQMWIPRSGYSRKDWGKYSKHNDWLIKEFSKFIQISNCPNPLLVLFEFGSDVEETKKLITDLGVDNNVLWISKSDRKEIMLLLNACTIGVGEFHSGDIIWGGTGWEVLSAGKPLLQSFTQTKENFQEAFGYPPPPMLAVKTRNDILNHLVEMERKPAKRHEIGKASAKWFNRFNGIGLAQKWLDLILK